jgi:hypothetical protein
MILDYFDWLNERISFLKKNRKLVFGSVREKIAKAKSLYNQQTPSNHLSMRERKHATLNRGGEGNRDKPKTGRLERCK